MSMFVIYDYTNCKDPNRTEPEVQIATLKELFDEIDAARKDDEVKIAVYEIGDCLLDWSS